MQQDFPQSPALQALVETLRTRYGDAIAAVLLYGSCLRSGDLLEGVVDLYLVVDGYRSFYSNNVQAAANRILAPNVFYLEIAVGEQTLRAKYAVISAADLRRGTSWRWFHSYIWARFAQPTAIVWSRDDASRQMVIATLSSAVRTFLGRVLPRLPATGDVQDIWRRGFQLTYAAELRSEKPGRAAELTAAALDYYVAATHRAAASLRYKLELEVQGENLRYHCQVPTAIRWLSRFTWPLRMVQGKLLSVVRLLKALFTFDNGLDYIEWKLQRHSGQDIEIPDQVRRRPLIFMWGYCWRLYRRGVFR